MEICKYKQKNIRVDNLMPSSLKAENVRNTVGFNKESWLKNIRVDNLMLSISWASNCQMLCSQSIVLNFKLEEHM